MITKRKIEIYKKYSGDIDAWARYGKTNEFKTMNDNDWKLIDELIHNIELIDKNLVSDEFKAKTEFEVNKLCDNEITQARLKALAFKFS